uniref:Uncharacterized protein n=1 Tax=Globodera rostochiensis TaxID=31243 RepID=A0A914I1K3_GLORO
MMAILLISHIHRIRNIRLNMEAVTMSRHNHHPSFDVWDQFILEESLLMGPNPEEVLLQEEDDYLVPNPFAIASLQDQLPNQYFDEFTPGHTVPKDKTESSSSHTVDSSNESNPDFMLAHKNLRILKIKLQEAEINHSLSPTTYRIQFINTKFANASKLEYRIQFINTKFANASKLKYRIQFINTKFANASKLEYRIQFINTKFTNASKLEYRIQFINTKFTNASKLEYRIQFINTKFANASKLECHIQFINTKFADASKLEYLIQFINTKFTNASKLEYLIQFINTKFTNASKLECRIQFINTKFANASESEFRIQFINTKFTNASKHEYSIQFINNEYCCIIASTRLGKLNNGSSVYRIHYDESVVFERFCVQHAEKQMYYYGVAVYRNHSEHSVATGCYLCSNQANEYGADFYRTQLDAYVGYKHPELNLQQIPENAANSSFGCATKTTFLEIFSQSIGEHFVVLLTEWQKRMPTNGPVQIEDTIFQNEFFKKHCEHLNKKY